MINRSNLITNSLCIPTINDFCDLSRLLSISENTLYLMINKKNYFYSVFSIKKKNGSERTIAKPSLSLKVIQKWILVEILQKIKVSKESMAFVPNKNGLKESAELHKNNLFLLQMDISHFFDSIKFNRVYCLFLNMGYSKEVAYILSELCTFNGAIPQGAVTSPYIANLICYKMDARINGVCRKRDIVYSRYADDMCFSCDNRIELNKVKAIISKIIIDEGFNINESKTRISSPMSRKSVLNITINDNKIHVVKKYKRILRSKIFHAITTGDYHDKESIIGSIAYVTSIEEDFRSRIIEYINEIIKRDYVKKDCILVEKYNHNKFFSECNDCSSE